VTDDRPQRAPYPGLRSFRREETDLFFGREDCIHSMVDRLATTRFLAVLGSSGTGKSSLVKTGLLDALELGVMAKAGSRWKVVEFRPGGAPLKNLARGLLEPDELDGGPPPTQHDVDLLRAYIARGPRAIVEWCNAGHLTKGTNLLLLVDQFEELFRYQDYAGSQEAEAFVALLLESAREKAVPIYVALTMRSEYLGACALIEGLSDAINQGTYLTPRMTREQCREAIVGPAAVCNIDIEPALVNWLLNDLANFADEQDSHDQLDRIMRRADQLPLLQYTLNRMWLRARERSGADRVRLTLDDYTAIRGLSGALNAHADQIVEDLGKARAPIVETIFRALTAGSSAADAVRRPTRFDELVALCGGDEANVRAVVDAFRAPGVNFLVPEIDPDNPTIAPDEHVDISHESLIRRWKRLAGWVEAEGRAAQQWRRLIDRQAQGEMLRGRELANLTAWRAETNPNPAWAKRYGGDFGSVIAFLDKSYKAQNRARVTMVASTVAAFVLVTGFALYAIVQRNQQLQLAKRYETLFEESEKSRQLVGQMLNETEAERRRAENERERAENVTKNLNAFLDSIVFAIADQYATSDSRPSLPVETQRGTDERERERSADRTTSGDRTTSERKETRADPGVAITTSTLDSVRRLAQANPNDRNIQRYLLVSLNMYGDVKLRQNDVPSAEAAFDESLRIVRELLRYEPENDFWREDLAVTLFKVASIRARQQKFDEERKLYGEAIPIYRAYIARNPTTERLLQNYQDHLGRFADVLVRLGDKKQARQLFTERLEARRSLLKMAPGDVSRIENLSQALDRVAQLMRDDGEYESARQVFEEALRVDRDFLRRFPERRTALEYVSISLGRLGDLDLNLGRPRDALRYYTEALPIQRRLLAGDVKAAGARRSLATLLGKVSDVRRQLREYDVALQARQEEITLRRGLLKDEPSNVPTQQDLSAALDNLGNIYRDMGNFDAARVAYDEQLEIDSALARADPSNVSRQHNLAWSLDRLGDLDRRVNRLQDSAKHFEAVLSIQRKLIARDPDNLSRIRALASALGNVSDIRSRLKNHSAALGFAEEELKIRRELIKRATGDGGSEGRDLSLAVDRVGRALRDGGDLQGAHKYFLEELEIDRGLVTRSPNDVSRLADLQWTLNMIGEFTRSRLSDRPATRQYFTELVDIDRRLLEREPRVASRHKRLVDDLGKLADLSLDVGALEAARRAYGDAFAASEQWIALAREEFKRSNSQGDRNDLLTAYRSAGWRGILGGSAPAAARYIEAALALVPNSPADIVNLAHTHLIAGRYAEAMRLYNSVKDMTRDEGRRRMIDDIRDDFVLFRRLGMAPPDLDRAQTELRL
jgi:tetratricopeptide (TPR) repeat protein